MATIMQRDFDLAQLSEGEIAFLKRAVLIRRLEEKLLSLFAEGKINGTIHTCIGQEFAGLAVIDGLEQCDCVFSTHRGHGHFIAKTGNVRGLVAELMGRVTGVCRGIGGSQHLHSKYFFSNGVQGAMMPVAVGRALACKYDGGDAVVVSIIGDGTLGEGVVYESLNIASKWCLPLLIVVENNYYAQSTKVTETLAGSIEGRARAFGVAYRHSDTWNWRALLLEAREAVEQVRRDRKPLLFQVETYRLKAHSKGDDNRSSEEVGEFERRDVLTRLLASGSPSVTAMVAEIDTEIARAVEEASGAPVCDFLPRPSSFSRNVTWERHAFKGGRMSELISTALVKTFDGWSKAVLIGEDVMAPYGGAFKISREISQRFPDRVLNTPISEAAIAGIGTGLALGGYRPFVEIMFGDFMTLIFDQLLQASKIHEMYGEDIALPMVIRSPMGGRRGYGPTHSQSIEKFFLGMPNVEVVSLNVRIDPGLLLDRIMTGICRPTLLIENKVLYTRFLKVEPPTGFEVFFSDEPLPATKVSPIGTRPDVTIVCFGDILDEVEEAVVRVFLQNEIVCEIICPSQIQPLNIFPVMESVKKTGRIVTVEEGCRIAGFGSEVIARIAEHGSGLTAVRRVGYDSILPASYERENALLPSEDSIATAICEVMR